MSVLLFAGALFVLRSELRQHSLSEIFDELRRFSPLRLFLALGATLLSFLALAGYASPPGLVTLCRVRATGPD